MSSDAFRERLRPGQEFERRVADILRQYDEWRHVSDVRVHLGGAEYIVECKKSVWMELDSYVENMKANYETAPVLLVISADGNYGEPLSARLADLMPVDAKQRTPPTPRSSGDPAVKFDVADFVSLEALVATLKGGQNGRNGS